MKIGIIFAMEEELNAFLNQVKFDTKVTINKTDFYEVTYKSLKLVLSLSGVGKVNAALTTQILIDKYNPAYIINAGVAGAVDKKLNILDIVVADNLLQHDFNITAFDHEKGYIPGLGVKIPCDKSLVLKAKEIEKVNVGLVASGDIFITDDMMGAKINKKFKALCVEMEGAAIAQACYLSNVPFLVIKCISDTVLKENNTLTYNEFLDKSSDKIAKYLLKILNILD